MTERIWIMGASDGIGAELARQYAARGAKLVLSARSGDALAQVARDAGGAEIIVADVTDLDTLKEAARQIQAGGKLDRAITLAGIYDPGKAMEIDLEQAAQIVSVNLVGALNFAHHAQPLLRHAGQLVVTGSVSGYVGLPQGQIYSASKAGVINLAETLRTELAGQTDVRVINPGFVDTRMTRQNDFDMPFIIEPSQAASAIIRGLDGRGFEVHFPKKLTLPLKLLRVLPYWVKFPLTRRLVR